MDVITLEAQPRAVGTKAARAVRREDKVPCVLYGHHADPVAFKVEQLSLRPLIFTDELHLVTVKVEGKAYDCIVKNVDFHPTKDVPLHVDFQVLQKGEMITVVVPIQFHGVPKGKAEGGVMRMVINEVEISCLPKDIPSHLDVDITNLSIGDVIHISDLDFPDIEFHVSEDQTVAMVTMPRTETVDEEDEEEGVVGLVGEDEDDEDDED